MSKHEYMTAVVIMGVAGCGKSTVGVALAERFAMAYVEGDDLHDPANIEKMTSGYSLTDEDRQPWLQRIGEQIASSTDPLIVSCSALKRSYRDLIRQHAEKQVLFLHLAASQSVIAERMEKRAGHFMPTTLLESQFKTLEPLNSDETGAVIDITQSLELSINDASNIMEQYLS